MKKIKGLFFLILINLASIPFANCSDRLLWPFFKTDLPFDSSITAGKLENGFRYLIKKNNTPEKRVAVYIGVMAGSLMENDEQQGIAHFLEHIVFCGSKNFPPGELIKYFQRIGMDFGADTNAHTGFDETVYKIFLPDGSDKEISEAFTILNDFVSKALILQSEVNRERGVILSEKVSRDSGEYRTRVKKYKFLFDGLKLPDRFPIGTQKVIKNADSALLKSFYNRFYTPDRMVLAVVGDVEVSKIEDLVKKYFSDIKKNNSKKFAFEFGKLKAGKGIKAFYHHENEAGSTRIGLNIVKDGGFETDSVGYQEKWLKRYMSMMIISNRLNFSLEKEDPPYQSANAFAFNFMRRILWAQIAGETDFENWEKTLETFILELKRGYKFGFKEYEVSRVRDEVMAMMEKGIEASTTRDSKALASEIVSSAMNAEIIVSPVDQKKIFFPILKKITADDLNKSFREMWSLEDLSVTVTGDLKLENNPELKIKKAAEKFFREEVSENTKIKKREFPYLYPDGKKIKIMKKQEFKDLGIKRIVLENNICLNFKKTDFKKDFIILKASFGKGSAFEKSSQSGINYLCERVVNLSGTGELGREELLTLLAGSTAETSFGIDPERFYIKGESSKKDMDTLFSLVFHQFKDPGVKEQAYRLAVKRLETSYFEKIKSVDGIVALDFQRFFAGNDKRFGIPEFEEIKKLNFSQAKDHVINNFKNGSIEISVAGDFEEKELINTFIKYFSSFEKRIKIEEYTPEPVFFPEGKTKAVQADTDIKGAFVIAGLKTDDITPITRTRSLNLSARILSERLRVEIREKLGVSYSPFAYHNASRLYENYGGLYLGVKTTPDMISKVKTEIERIVREIRKGEISDDEFNRSLKPLVNTIRTTTQSNNYWVESVLDGSYSNPLQIKWAETIISGYSSVTKDMVVKEIKKYVKPENLSFFIVKSKPDGK